MTAALTLDQAGRKTPNASKGRMLVKGRPLGGIA